MAVGLPMKNDGRDNAPRNAADGAVSAIVTIEVPLVLQLAKRLPFGAPEFGSYVLNPPKTVCQ